MSSVNLLRATWKKLSGVPGGKILFNKFLGRAIPYSGTISPEILELRPGYARVRMAERRRVRNHLNCVHAVALTNIAELATGIAFNFGLPPNTKAICVGLEIDFVKKARGILICECSCDCPATNEEKEYEIAAKIVDASGNVVANYRAKWLVRPS